jgi:hypothetical protein
MRAIRIDSGRTPVRGRRAAAMAGAHRLALSDAEGLMHMDSDKGVAQARPHAAAMPQHDVLGDTQAEARASTATRPYWSATPR